MPPKECLTCQGWPVCRKERRAWFFIGIGIIATISIRIVTVLMHWDPFYGKLAWYIGVGGFIVFFTEKFLAFRTRAKLIEENKILEKVNQGEALSLQDRAILSQILCRISSHQERINFLIIFISSAIALVVAIYFDFFNS